MVDSLELNCDCDDDWPSETLLDLRKYLLTRLGFAAMLNTPPPGMAALCNSFIDEAQKLLYRRYSVLRTGRWFTWNMTAGARFYDLGVNDDACDKKLDPRRVKWAGISKGDDVWQPLICGIDPSVYSSRIESFPQRYEIRQCIEVWPAPSDDTWLLRIKGDFGLSPLVVDDDTTTVDADAIKLLALANAKAHYGQPDASNYMTQLTTLLGDLNAASHLTRRYIPGERVRANAIPPKLIGGYQP